MAERWRGAQVQQIQVPIDKAWAVLREFCGMGKWVKTFDSVEMVEGEEFKPGCVRLIKSTNPDPVFAKEKLLILDDENKTQKYEVVDSSLGLVGYEGSIKVDHLDEKSCTVTWSFETSPTEGTTEEAVAQLMTTIFGLLLTMLEEYCA